MSQREMPMKFVVFVEVAYKDVASSTVIGLIPIRLNLLVAVNTMIMIAVKLMEVV